MGNSHRGIIGAFTHLDSLLEAIEKLRAAMELRKEMGKLEENLEAWERYLDTDPKPPDPGLARNITQVNEISSTIAAAVEERGAATKEIARNAQEAARGTSDVATNMSGVTEAAGETGTAATLMLDAVKAVAAQSQSLRDQVDGFLSRIRAA